MARAPRFDRPVFILGIPRSGTSSLFRVLGTHPDLGSLGHEGHDIWRMFHHPRLHAWRSDAVEAGEVGVVERRFVPARFRAHFPHRRFVEKTPENSLRVGYLLDLFPDARFIVIHRDPADTLNSLINGWRDPAGRYRSYHVPERLTIPDYPHRYRWCFALIDGWRGHRSSPIPDIAMEQWRQLGSSLVQWRRRVDPSQWTEIQLEHLRQHPEATLRAVLERLGLPDHPSLHQQLSELRLHPANALSPPRLAKWRQENSAAVRERLPAMAPLASELGYAFDSRRESFEPAAPIT